MRRGKPHQEIYRPGSGPLRKSNFGNEESEADTILAPNSIKYKPFSSQNSSRYDDEISAGLNEPNNAHVARKLRKPEQMIYVPKAVANAREMAHDNERQTNGNSDRFRSKRYSNLRQSGFDNNEDEWREGATSRNLLNGQRTRDTRSVEPFQFSTRSSFPKPPSGRRHSTVGLENEKRQIHKPLNVEKLAPRFRKKMLEETRAQDDNWNGTTLTFQGSGNNYNSGNIPSYQLNSGYCTLPNRHRGRGRLHREYDISYRSQTPDLVFETPPNSRPPTPSRIRTRSNDNLHKNHSRPQSPIDYGSRNDFRSGRERGHWRNNYGRSRNDTRTESSEVLEENRDTIDHKLEVSKQTLTSPKLNSSISPPISEEKSKPGLFSNSNTALDWGEEVELNDPCFEQETWSDAPTRSSSVASLIDISIKSTPPNNSTNLKKSKSKRSNRRHRHRSGSHSRSSNFVNQTVPPDDIFKLPLQLPPNRRPSRDRRESSYERYSGKKNCEPSFERNKRDPATELENWREENRSRRNSEREYSDRSRNNSERENGTENINVKKAGMLVLPQQKLSEVVQNVEQPRYPDMVKPCHQKSLFDHNNPNKPIIVLSPGPRVSVPGFTDNVVPVQLPNQFTTDQFGNVRPGWYEENSDGFKLCHYPNLIIDIKRADNELQSIMNSGVVLQCWGTVESLRQFLKQALQYLLCKDLKFCQTENLEQHLWKILYHNIIEATRKAITNDHANKERYKGFLLYLIDEGTTYFESLLDSLEQTYNFKLNNYLGNSSFSRPKGMPYVGLALISAQKILLFLGDLGRYRELANETSNFGKCRQWYIKAHEINSKNGRPYNQLAVVAVLARRKLDAVYYYMRSLMSSNPVLSAKESLTCLFDENKKKYEQGERKRREERRERVKHHMKEKESENHHNGSLRHETWIHPDGRRTIQAIQEQKDSEEEDLAELSSVEVNKRFVISYLHVHGKLFTRTGMESFQETAMQMLKEFRALLLHSPVPLPCNRFLQLLALNMFAIESTQLKDKQLQAGYRSELQEKALIVSLQMFNLILERCVCLMAENNSHTFSTLSQDIHILLPAIKIWCDWLLCHSSIWNPPPSTQDFKIGNGQDCWSRMATLMNFFEKLDSQSSVSLASEFQEGYEPIKLPEDSVLFGFTPLMVNDPSLKYAFKDIDLEMAQFALRVSKLQFFGTVFLCGLEPPVLKLEIEDDFREYVSVVSTSNSRDSPVNLQLQGKNNDVLLKCFSDEEVEEYNTAPADETSLEVRDLLSRKVELERKHRKQELHKLRVEKILSQAVVSVHIEVRPKYLVPDTNCFIDHLDRITSITASNIYTLMVPIVVLSELEGLSRGGKSPTPPARSSLDPQHVKKVAEAAKSALSFLKNRSHSVKCVTTKGAVLSSTTFTTEDDSVVDSTFKNDDKILATCLALSKGHREQAIQNEPKKLFSEVVLLTDDRNLRVKALSRDVPVRELLDFMNWSGLG